MNKRKVKILATIVPLLILVSALSGCIAANAIQTKHWDHTNTEGTGVRLWGYLILGENFHNWDAYFVYDTERHDNWEHYQFRITEVGYDDWNWFHADIDGLDRKTEYHYRAVGEHRSQGATIRVGVDRTFIPGGPRVIVKGASAIGINTAVIEGKLTHMGGASSCDVWFKYGTDPDSLDMETPKETMTSTGDFNYELTGLSSCQTYYYRAVGSNDADTWDSFYYLGVTPGMPLVETYLPHEVTTTSALYRGELFFLGGPATCDVWFEYGDQSPNNLDETSDSVNLDAPEFFSIEVDGLNPGTTYWVRSVADNGLCQYKGEVKEFTTLPGLGETIYEEKPISTLKEKIQTFIQNQVETLLYDVLGIPEDAPKELIIDSYPILGRLLEKFG